MLGKILGNIGILAVFAFTLNMANAGMDGKSKHPPMPMFEMPTVYEDVGFINDMEFSSTPFYIPVDTTSSDNFYRATLTDFENPAAFDLLGLDVTTSTTSMGAALITGDGQKFFDFDATPGVYYANLFGVAGGELDLGLYGVQIAMVPEMEVWAMMLAGMGLIGYQLRRQRNGKLRA